MTQHHITKPGVGFIGMGNMGSLMALRLLQAGYRVTVYDRTKEKTQEVAKNGATVANTPRDLAQNVDCILSCVTNYEALMAVMEGPYGAIAGARPNTIFIDLSTIAPDQSRAVAEAVQKQQRGRMLDAAVSGSTPQAAQGELVIFVGGDKQVFEQSKPLLEQLGKSIFYIGESGKGTSMKMVVNDLLGLELQAIAEAITLGEKLGLAKDQLADILSQTTVIAPAHKAKLQNYKKGEYPVNFALSLMHKDFTLIRHAAGEHAVPMPATAAAEQMYQAALAQGYDDDFSVMIDFMRKLAGLSDEK